ncbi:hypothetical protein ACWKWU_14355 [Chitinophaga lutea]
MRKIGYLTLILSAVFVFASNTGYGQTQKGNVMVGANLANFAGMFQNDVSTFSMDLTPKAAWFIKDNLAIGPMINLGLRTGNNSTIFTYGVGAFGRYFISDKNIELTKKTRWFLEASAGFNGVNSKIDDVSSDTNGLGLGFGPGLAYFITPNIALEGLVKYDLTVGFGSSTTAHKVSLNLGFQIYLPGAKARQAVMGK